MIINIRQKNRIIRKQVKDLKVVWRCFDSAIVKLGEVLHRIFRLILRQKLSWRPIAVMAGLGLLAMPVMCFNAFESFVINVTAEPVNDMPKAMPAGGEFCDLESAIVDLETAMPEGEIRFTLDGSDPDCSPHGFLYEGSIVISETSLLKACVCHDERQSAVNSWQFTLGREFCSGQPGPGSTGGTVHIITKAQQASNQLLNLSRGMAGDGSQDDNNEDTGTGSTTPKIIQVGSSTPEAQASATSEDETGEEEEEEEEEESEAGGDSASTTDEVLKEKNEEDKTDSDEQVKQVGSTAPDKSGDNGAVGGEEQEREENNKEDEEEGGEAGGDEEIILLNTSVNNNN